MLTLVPDHPQGPCGAERASGREPDLQGSRLRVRPGHHDVTRLRAQVRGEVADQMDGPGVSL